jgi:alpha-tubulin suppressor-like RCC1 family protein
MYCAGGTCSECVLDVAPGRRHLCSLRYDGTVWCSGQNETGQRGQTASYDRIADPVQLRGADGQPFGDVVSLGSGRVHSCAVRRDGTAWCWGHNSQGQLGNGSTNIASSPMPTQVMRETGGPLANIIAVRAGYCHTCALDGAKGVWCWGCDTHGQLGDGAVAQRPRAVPVLTAGAGSPPFTGVEELTVGHQHSCVRTTAGIAYCWGRNHYGQVGDGRLGGLGFVPSPIKVLDEVTTVAAGSEFTCATRTDGSAWCWGRASGDRLGDGDDELPSDKDIPTQVVTEFQGPPFLGATTVSVGAVGCVLTTDTGAWCWGKNLYGTTGGGGGSTVPAPVIDSDGAQLMNLDRLVGHYAHTCAHQTTGRYVCWGRNTSGQLANGTLAHTGIPAPLELTCP